LNSTWKRDYIKHELAYDTKTKEYVKIVQEKVDEELNDNANDQWIL
jgi:hypothetical protein